jgi:hypothetical protein
MPILFPTGTATEALVREAVAGLDAEVAVTGEIASFLTPQRLLDLVRADRYDYVVVPGMCTASFAAVEEATGVPILRGPRHAADLPLMVELLGKVEFSRDVPADDLLRDLRRDDAYRKVRSIEKNAEWDLLLRGVKVGGTSRCKVLAELMDAHRRPDLRSDVERAFCSGADIVDLGFGFDATPADVARCFGALDGIDGPLAVDSQDPALIAASLFRADLVLSLQEENIPMIGRAVADAGAAAVVVPRYSSLTENLEAAERPGARPWSPTRSSSLSARGWSGRSANSGTTTCPSSSARVTWSSSWTRTRSGRRRSSPAWPRRSGPPSSSRPSTRTRPGARSPRCGGRPR